MVYIRMAVLQFSRSVDAGSTVDWARLRGATLQIHRLDLGEPIPSIKDFDILIACGGGMNVDDFSNHPYLAAARDLLGQSVAAGKAVVGLCLGGQMLARAHGALVRPNAGWEAGFQQVEIGPLWESFKPAHSVVPEGVRTRSAQSVIPAGDLANSQPQPVRRSPLRVFQWHSDHFDLPDGAVALGQSAGCAHQAFRLGELAFGFQFHPETQPDWAERLLHDESEPAPAGPFVQARAELARELHSGASTTLAGLRAWYFAFLDELALRYLDSPACRQGQEHHQSPMPGSSHNPLAAPVGNTRRSPPPSLMSESLRVCTTLQGHWQLSPCQALPGSSIFISRWPAASLTDLSPDALSAFWRQAHEIGQRLMARLGAHRVNFEVWGNQTPWLHVHITPRFQSEGEQAVILPPRQAYAWAPETAPQVPGPWTDGLTKVESRAATERALAAHLL